MTTTSVRRIRAVSRRDRATVLRSVVVLHSTRSAYGRDPWTGALIVPVTELPPVHSSGAFLAYSYGMPDVPNPLYPPCQHCGIPGGH